MYWFAQTTVFWVFHLFQIQVPVSVYVIYYILKLSTTVNRAAHWGTLIVPEISLWFFRCFLIFICLTAALSLCMMMHLIVCSSFCLERCPFSHWGKGKGLLLYQYFCVLCGGQREGKDSNCCWSRGGHVHVCHLFPFHLAWTYFFSPLILLCWLPKQHPLHLAKVTGSL